MLVKTFDTSHEEAPWLDDVGDHVDSSTMQELGCLLLRES